MDKAINTSLINRALKRHRQLRKWARREGVTSYRIYDRDIPAAPITIDLYEFLPEGITDRAAAAAFMKEREKRISQNDAHITEEIARRQYLVVNSFLDESGEERSILPLLESAFNIREECIILKTRERGKGGSRYAHYEGKSGNGTSSVTGTVYESGLIYKADLARRIDTGLFLDHRPLRSIIRQESGGQSVLNLFCYTASFSVCAAQGGAESVTSVDLSNTYLDWAVHNMKLNGFGGEGIRFVKSDVSRFLESAAREGARYDIILLDPPTFSNSASAAMLDLERGWSALVRLCTQCLSKDGTLYFSTNSRRLRVRGEDAPKGFAVEDITQKTIPPDFPLHKPHRCYKFTPAEKASTLPQRL